MSKPHISFGIRFPTLRSPIPGLKLQLGTFLLELFYGDLDVLLELPGGLTFFWGRLMEGWGEWYWETRK